MKDNIITASQKNEYIELCLLYLMIENQQQFSISLEEEKLPLKIFLMDLVKKGELKLDHDLKQFVVINKGYKRLEKLHDEYEDFIMKYDIYSAIDLEKFEFAFKDYFNYEEEEWLNYIEQERFEDFRLLVAIYKKEDPLRIVFMNLLYEGLLDYNQPSWPSELVSEKPWHEIESIVKKAIKLEDLAYTNEDGEFIRGEKILQEILYQGELLLNFLKSEERKFIN